MALPTSGTYNALSITAEIVIRDAFENIGIPSEFLDVAKYNAAIRALNLILQDWMSKSYNLWTIQSEYMQLIQGQPSYVLPEYVNDIVQINTRTFTRLVRNEVDRTLLDAAPYSFTRQLGGTPQSNTGASYDNGGGGNPAFAFDGNPTTACTQNANDGNISYDFGMGNVFGLVSVGIQSNVNNLELQLIVEASADSVTWVPVITPSIINRYYKGIQLLFLNTTAAYRYFRVRSLEGLLDVQEIYFNVEDGLNTAAFINSDIPCAQIQPNGSIGYAYSNVPSAAVIPRFVAPATQVVNMVGIQVPANLGDQTYTLVVEGNSILTFNNATNNSDNPDSVINLGLQTLLTLPKQTYPAGVTQWFDLGTSLPVTYIQIRETGGATLNINQVYFVNNTVDTTVSEVSLYNYQNFPQKYQQGRPSCFYMQRNSNNINIPPFSNPPLLYLWPVPDNYWNLIQITYEKMMQDVTYLAQGIDIPARFYPSLIWALTWRLAMKYKPDIAQMYKVEYEQSFREATLEDSENVPITITINDEAY